MRSVLCTAFAAAALLPAAVLAKGEGVGLWMEGQVSEVRAEGQNIRLVVTGRFWFEQHRGAEPAVVEVRDLRGGPASITAAMLLMGQAGADLLKIAVFFLVLLIALAITYLTLMLVEPLGRILGVTGTNVIARISGILLAALAVQFIFNGIRDSHLLG